MKSYEQLGAFYLGKEHDLASGTTADDLVLYDSKDLTTHAVCVGMTGSGKTGLCIGVLEEAAIDGIPALVIDPKGDLGNLMLMFPELRPSDFRPWIDEREATRKGMTPDDYAKKTASMWSDGLAAWQQDGERIRNLQATADVCLYTPGSAAGRPLTILRSFSAPPQEVLDDSDALRDRVQGAVSGLLALLGITADPIRSREHILLSCILNRAWTEGRNLDLAAIIGEIQKPPFDRVGVFDLESFYPAKERFDLALMVNGMLASPGFSSWMEGEPLSIGNLLYAENGKPRIAVLSIAHLSESERMFFVTILLNEVLSWMRTQPGTGSLRALIYMDEIFGYFPPTANPPSKHPMLTLLKQARAYGVGVMLATQNPVDLDYKGLANTGTWFIGKLQTERDKARVLDGLEGATATAGGAFDRQAMERCLAQLGNRVFLMHNVHEDAPRIFETRWVMSYLRGPLTRSQIQMLSKETAAGEPTPVARQVSPPAAPTVASAAAAAMAPEVAAASTSTPPVVPPSVPQFWLPLRKAAGDTSRLAYRPSLAGIARLHYVDAKSKTDMWSDVSLLASLPEEGPFVNWEEMAVRRGERMEMTGEATQPGDYAKLSADASKPSNYASWEKQIKTHLYQYQALTLWHCAKLKAYSKPEEAEGEFRSRLALHAREMRDIEVEKLRQKYGAKLATLQGRVDRAREKVSREKDQYQQQTSAAVISIGATIVGALFGRKVASYGTVGRAATAMKGAGRASKEKGEVKRAEDALGQLQEQLAAIGTQMEADLEEARNRFQVEDLELAEMSLRPRKTDITVARFGLCWCPFRVGSDGIAEPLF